MENKEPQEDDDEDYKLRCDRCGNEICLDSDMIVYEDDLYDDGSVLCSDCRYADFCSTGN